MKKMWLAALTALLLAACSTSKADLISEIDGREYIPLAPGALVYMYADVAQMGPLLAILPIESLSQKEVADMVERTDSAMMAFYPNDTKRSFMLAGAGSYPTFGVNMGLFFSSTWKKQRSETGASYWYSEKSRSALSLSANQVFVSDADPFAPVPGVAIPEDFAAFRRDAVLALWLDDAAVPVNQFLQTFLASLGIGQVLEMLGVSLMLPVGQTMISVQAVNENYSALIRIGTSSVSQTRGILGILALIKRFLPSTDSASLGSPIGLAAILFANDPQEDGLYLTLRTGEFDAQSLVALVSMFTAQKSLVAVSIH
ncbi:MAG: hypothetical protein LBJ41_00325 [Treponema sp.]|jgi:hypothetical protein|nr:hypothetical protein [Treponema sp.]